MTIVSSLTAREVEDAGTVEAKAEVKGTDENAGKGAATGTDPVEVVGTVEAPAEIAGQVVGTVEGPAEVRVIGTMAIRDEAAGTFEGTSEVTGPVEGPVEAEVRVSVEVVCEVECEVEGSIKAEVRDVGEAEGADETKMVRESVRRYERPEDEQPELDGK
jgi:hypothetical protein